MNVRGVLFILSVVSTMYRIGSKADLLRRQEEVDAGLGLDVTFTINKSMLCDSGRNWIKKQCSKQGRRIARNCRVRPNSMYISVSSFSVFFLLLTARANSNIVHERQQLPLRLAWAFTIHKSQGMTLSKAWVDIGKSERTVGMSYVALSRVKRLSSLIVEPMSFERLQKIRSAATFQYRLQEQERLQRLADETATSNK